jgi:predicted metal-dependent hydrolase
MRALLRWHAAEEIEHRAVAFDVLGVVDGRLRVRVAGFCMAGAVLALFWAQGVRHLLRQDPKPAGYVDPARARMRAYWRQHGPRFLSRLLLYVRRGFHPDQLGSDALAQAHIATMQAEGLVAA